MINRKQLTITCLAVATLAMGRKPSAQPLTTGARRLATQPFDKVNRETKEAAQEMADYAYAQKSENPYEEHIYENEPLSQTTSRSESER
jgi:ribosomal protein S4